MIAAVRRWLARLGLRRKAQWEMPAEFRPWYEGKEFTCDYTSLHLHRWAATFEPYKDCIRRILEIGCLEGRATIFFLEFFPHSHVTCIDPFKHAGTEQRFERNVAAYGPRVTKIPARSVASMDAMRQRGETFDLIYIDGEHSAIGVLADSALAMALAAPGGFIVWDDYGLAKRPLGPKPAIDAVLAVFRRDLTLVYKSYQVIARRGPV
jgi:hypothetical protein